MHLCRYARIKSIKWIFGVHTAYNSSIHIICRGARMNVPFIHKCSTKERRCEKKEAHLKNVSLKRRKKNENAFGDIAVTNITIQFFLRPNGRIKH